jgi:hypothetical protein
MIRSGKDLPRPSGWKGLFAWLRRPWMRKVRVSLCAHPTLEQLEEYAMPNTLLCGVPGAEDATACVAEQSPPERRRRRRPNCSPSWPRLPARRTTTPPRR